MRRLFFNNNFSAGLTIWILIFGLLISNTHSGSASSTPSPSAVQQPSPSQTGQSAGQQYFTDVELTNQNGQKMRLYSDLLKGKVVIINSFFSTCPGSCLPLIQNMQKLQTALGDRVGNDRRRRYLGGEFRKVQSRRRRNRHCFHSFLVLA